MPESPPKSGSHQKSSRPPATAVSRAQKQKLRELQSQHRRRRQLLVIPLVAAVFLLAGARYFLKDTARQRTGTDRPTLAGLLKPEGSFEANKTQARRVHFGTVTIRSEDEEEDIAESTESEEEETSTLFMMRNSIPSFPDDLHLSHLQGAPGESSGPFVLSSKWGLPAAQTDESSEASEDDSSKWHTPQRDQLQPVRPESGVCGPPMRTITLRKANSTGRNSTGRTPQRRARRKAD